MTGTWRDRIQRLKKIPSAFKSEPQNPLEDGLNRLSSRLGLQEQRTRLRSRLSHCTVAPAEECARTIFYAPDMDGQVDPGEVVWFWTPHKQTPIERALVVVGRSGSQILGLLASSNPEHSQDRSWLDIGSGPWDENGRQSWVRLDRVIKIPETEIRRQGAVIPPRRFERIANRLRADFGWG